MHHKLFPSAVAAAIATLAVLPAAALGEEVTITGCAQPGVEAGCIVMSTAAGLYNITAAKPTPMIAVGGKVTGTVSSGVSLCSQGKILAPATWTPVDGVACPDAPRR